MIVNQRDTRDRKRFAFRDVRTAVELLAAGRPPKSLQFLKKNGVSKKISKLTSKIGGSKLFSALKTKALPLAAKVGLGPVAGAIAAKVAGKYAAPLFGKLKKPFTSAQKASTVAAVGVKITEELDPENIRRPQQKFNGRLSRSAAAAAENLAETVATGALTGLISGSSMGSGLPTLPRNFKTTAALAKSPRFFNPNQRTFPVDAKEKATADKAVRHVEISTPQVRLYPQSGLLEDELMYRLVLLAENVYKPTHDHYPNIQILDGFRTENSTTSQHERGEALDLTAGSASDNFAVAQWMRDHILYDQLILCHDISGDSWIHVSFSIDARRRQVLTKTLNDTFVDGLHIYTPNADAAAAAAADLTAGDEFATMMSQRQQRLEPVSLGTNLPQQTSDLLNASAGAGGSDGPRCLERNGQRYVPDNSAEGTVTGIVESLLRESRYLEMVQNPDRREMVEFAREVVRQARANGHDNVGMNAVRGNSGDPSGDAIAIRNPTAGAGINGSWATEDRVQVMDIVGGAHGGVGSNPTASWTDVTNLCGAAGGFLDP